MILLSLSSLVACGAGKPTEDSVGGSVQGIDHTPPPAPTITTPDTNPYTSFSASRKFTIRGKVADEVVQIIGPAGVTVVPNAAREWSFEIDLSSVATVTAAFFAKDFAGNASTTSTSVTIGWNPPVLFLLGGLIPGGPVTDSGKTFEASIFAPITKVTDPVSHITFESGFNRAVTSSRSL